jgi:hypothetical protein
MRDYLGFTVIAAIVTTCGTLLGLLLKDFLFVYYFDRLKEHKTLEKISKKYKDPILLSAHELYKRTVDYLTDYDVLSRNSTLEVLYNNSEKLSENNYFDEYFLKYKLRSTIYRFCSFFGWLELYRQDITFLDSHSKRKSFEFLDILSNVRKAVADGQLNKKKNWHDKLIFREELRAIGEGMIEVVKDQRLVIGYGKFQQLLKTYETKKEAMWLSPVINFFTYFDNKKDFRIERFELLRSSLLGLMRYLDEEYVVINVKNTS